MVTVMVSQPGAAPTEMETQILQKVEGAVANIGNVRNITLAQPKVPRSLFIAFEIGTPIDRAVSDVRDAVARVRGDLPEGIQEPVVQRIDTEGNAIAYYAVSATSMTEEQLSWFVDHTVSKRLLTLKGVAQVSRGGGVTREVRVDLDPSRLQALGITAVQVNQQLRTLNIDAAGGRAQISGGEQSIRVLGGARTSADLGSTQIQVGGGRTARLDEIARVYDGVGEIRTISRLNGRPATTFGVYRSRGNSDVDVFKRISKEVDAMLKDNPGVSAKIVFTTVENTQSS
jgi:multidrug efflux pump subunit AcrB